LAHDKQVELVRSLPGLVISPPLASILLRSCYRWRFTIMKASPFHYICHTSD
jgi:hypothetical protein